MRRLSDADRQVQVFDERRHALCLRNAGKVDARAYSEELDANNASIRRIVDHPPIIEGARPSAIRFGEIDIHRAGRWAVLGVWRVVFQNELEPAALKLDTADDQRA